jgi:RecA-family ATPase
MSIDPIAGERAENVIPLRPFVMYSELKESASKRWLVRGLLGEGESGAVYGQPGCGKSVLIEDMALHIAAKRIWHGREVRGGAVVYVALERKKLVERRAIAFRKKHKLQNLPFAVVGGVHDFRLPATTEWLADICKQVEKLTGEKVVLIVIDTLSRALAGGDENSPKDMGAIVTTTASLQDKTGAYVAWIHHMPHDGERMRGHGALLGAMDTTIHVTKSGATRAATVVKANDSEEGEQVTFAFESIEIGDDGTTAPVVVPTTQAAFSKTADQPRLSESQEAMLRLLRDAGPSGLSTAEWNAEARDIGIGVSRKATLHNLKSQLKDRGLVREYNDVWHVQR